MILTHGANSLERGNKSMLYLSYFDKLNVSTGADTPEIGTSSISSFSGTIGKTTRKYKNDYINFLCNISSCVLTEILDTTSLPEVVSIEWLDYFPSKYNMDSGTYAGGQFNINSSGSTVELVSSVSSGIGVTINNANNTLSANWGTNRSWSDPSSYTGGYSIVYNSTMTIGKLYHFAVVYDFGEKKMYGYVDGDLAVVNDFSSLTNIDLNSSSLNVIKINYSNWQTFSSQYAVFDYDKSTDNRTKYRVPNEPYWNFTQPTTETIGGKKYRTVLMPDGKTWMADNLDFIWDGLVVGGSSGSYVTPMANYPLNNSSSYNVDCVEPYGLLYNWAAAKYINDNRSTLVTGWHVPTQAEISALGSALGGNNVAGGKMKDEAYYGSNEYDFNLMMSGYCLNGNFTDLQNSASLWSISETSSSNADYVYSMYNDTELHTNNITKDYQFSIRLVKDT